MTLKERLNSLNENDYVYLSAGDSYFFIGKVRRAYEILPTLDSTQKAKLEDGLHKAVKMANNCPAIIARAKRDIAAFKEEQQRYINQYKNVCWDERYELQDKVNVLKWRIKDEERHLALAEHNLSKMPTRVEVYRNRLKNWKPLLDREIVEEYPRRFVRPLGTIIIIKGAVRGDFWTLEEFERVYGV